MSRGGLETREWISAEVDGGSRGREGLVLQGELLPGTRVRGGKRDLRTPDPCLSTGLKLRTKVVNVRHAGTCSPK